MMTACQRSRALQALVLLALGFAVLLPINRLGLSTFDEGFTLTGPLIILNGGVPLRDFFSNYGPAQFYLNAAAFSLFGEQMMVGRLLHVLVLALLGLAIAATARRMAGDSPIAGLWAWAAWLALCLIVIPTTNYSAHPACALLLGAGLLLGRAEAGRETNALARASLLVGLAGLFRWDFGLFGAGSLGVCALLIARAHEGAPRRQLTLLMAAAGPLLAVWLAVYVPLLGLWGDAGRWFREVPLFSLLEFKHWRSIDFVGPALDAFRQVWGLHEDPLAMAHTLFLLAFAFVPVPAALAVLILMGRGIAARPPAAVPEARLLHALFLGLVVFLLFNQMRVRPTLWQGFPAAAASLPLFALLYSEARQAAAPAGRLVRGLVLGLAGLLSACLAVVAWDSSREALGQPLVAAPMERARGIQLPAHQATYGQLVETVRRNTRPGERIYSGVIRHDLLWLNDVLIYFLADRLPADRFMELEPGLANTVAAQAEIIASLERHNVRLIVLSESFSNENNRTAQSNGVRTLDQYIEQHYTVIEKLPRYRVLLRKGEQAAAGASPS